MIRYGAVMLVWLLANGCASKAPVASNKFPGQPGVQVSGGILDAMPTSKVSRSKAFNVKQAVLRVLPKDWKADLWFEEVDNKNGYARVSGKMEGYIEYFLFVGDSKNLLVKSAWGCGPACTQEVSFYEMLPRSYKAVKFSEIVAKSVYQKFQLRFDNCVRGETFSSSKSKACSVILDWPKVGRVVKVYNASYSDNGVFLRGMGAKGTVLVEMVWDPKEFRLGTH